MKPNHYLAIGVRLFSIALFIYCFQQTSLLMEYIKTGTINGMFTSGYFVGSTVVLPFIIAVLLWFFPLAVSKAILKEEIDKEVNPISSNSFLTVLVLAIGIYTFYCAIADSVYWLTFWHMVESNQYDTVPMSLTPENKANMYATAFEFGFSIFLLFKARFITAKILQLTK